MAIGAPFRSGLTMPPAHGFEPFQLGLLWLTVFSGAFVLVDVAYSALAMLSLGVFALLGLRADRANIPLILFLVIFNLGAWLAWQPHLGFQESREFVIGTAFVAVTAIFYALCLNENGLARLEAIKWGLILGGLAASTAGLIGYARIAGLDAYFLMHGGRVSGTFRDPNVLGSFLVPGALYLCSDILRTSRLRLLRLALLLPIVAALFLSFSRGSWAAMVIGALCLFGSLYLTAAHEGMRARIALIGLAGIAAFAGLLALLLSFDGVAEIFADRFTLTKDYDEGPSGRFGTQLRAIPELLGLPFGYGPNRFWLYFPENPHNAYLMAFASYGWLGGITFLAFIATTLYLAVTTIFLRTPFQAHAIVLLACLVPHLVQNFQIDTDRWRHLFMIYGLVWGLAAVSRRWLGEYRAHAHDAYRRQAQLARQGSAQPAE